MKVKLDVLERMVIPQLFPEKGSFVENTVRQGATKVLGLTEDEIKEFEIEASGEGIKWNPEKIREVGIDLSDAAVASIKKALKALDDTSALEEKHMSLYKKFVANATSTDEKVAGKIDKKDE